MSQPYRVERELMLPGQTEPTYRVIVKLNKGWGRVQAGLDKEAADGLCTRLLDNEHKARQRFGVGGYRR